MAARAKVIESHSAASDAKGHPCFAKGSGIQYTYADKQYAVNEVVEAGDFKRCAAAAFKALDHDKDCGQPKVGFGGGLRFGFFTWRAAASGFVLGTVGGMRES